MLKYIGFFSEFNNIAESVSLMEQIQNTQSNENIQANLEQIIAYLEQGIILLPWMEYFLDKKGNIITPHYYASDGKWIWPSYFVYYLRKYPFLKINKAFLEHLQAQNYTFEIDKKAIDALQELEAVLAKSLHPVF